ncbi:T9SS type A sorting domain-containing protein [candidate division WOR-3 bacterium]|nr:T9SS type A sorting domain-containing protein [candidate division WOR-3 bacterium]
MKKMLSCQYLLGITFLVVLVILQSAIFAKEYAVLISGCDPDSPEASTNRFWNDPFLMWEILVEKRGWSDEDVYVIWADGTNWSQNQKDYADRYQHLPSIVDYAATRDNIQYVFNLLESLMTSEDFLYIWTNGHGGVDNEVNPQHASLALIWSREEVWDWEFADWISDIPHAYRVIVMQQCKSGGFVDDLENDSTVVVTSCSLSLNYGTSWACDDVRFRNGTYVEGSENERIEGCTYHHDEFVFHVMNAFSGVKPDGGDPVGFYDWDVNSRASVWESYDYVYRYDSRDTIWVHDPRPRCLAITNYSDPGDIGQKIFLEKTPLAPTGFDYVFGINGGVFVHLTWDNNIEIDLDGYNVYRNGVKINSGVVTVSQYDDHDVEPGGRYSYKITALDWDENESDYSEDIYVIVPNFIFAAGKSEPSPYLVQREGYYEWGETPYKTVDYHPDSLVYCITGLNPDKQYKMGILYYEPPNTTYERIQTLNIDGIQIHGHIEIPETPILICRWIPRTMYLDNEIHLNISRVQGENAIVSDIYIWEHEAGGGSQTAGEDISGVDPSPLLQNNPNPFKFETIIQYYLTAKSSVNIAVYDITGKLVRTLAQDIYDAGYHQITWDARDDKGYEIAGGVYFCKLQTGNIVTTKKMVVIR